VKTTPRAGAAAVQELYTEDGVFYDPSKGVYRGRDEIACKGAHASAEHLEIAKALFDAVGRTVVVDEKNMDAVTGLSASGPAFAYIILESLAEAGVKVGLPRDVATLLAAQTMERIRQRSAGNRRPSRAAERFRHHPCRLHH
jgi:Pyrroline-5-carboxylate reductase dimerisation